MNDLLRSELSEFQMGLNLIKYDLTKREIEVVFLITRGLNNKKIGSQLFISETTVKKHVYNIFNKLNIHSRFELISKILLNNRSYIEKAC